MLPERDITGLLKTTELASPLLPLDWRFCPGPNRGLPPARSKNRIEPHTTCFVRKVPKPGSLCTVIYTYARKLPKPGSLCTIGVRFNGETRPTQAPARFGWFGFEKQ